jgi:hypothetical protein
MQSLQDESELTPGRDPPSPTHAVVETRSLVEMPIMPPQGSLCSAFAHDQANRAAGDHAV